MGYAQLSRAPSGRSACSSSLSAGTIQHRKRYRSRNQIEGRPRGPLLPEGPGAVGACFGEARFPGTNETRGRLGGRARAQFIAPANGRSPPRNGGGLRPHPSQARPDRWSHGHYGMTMAAGSPSRQRRTAMDRSPFAQARDRFDLAGHCPPARVRGSRSATRSSSPMGRRMGTSAWSAAGIVVDGTQPPTHRRSRICAHWFTPGAGPDRGGVRAGDVNPGSRQPPSWRTRDTSST
jgi:hypothetical protein